MKENAKGLLRHRYACVGLSDAHLCLRAERVDAQQVDARNHAPLHKNANALAIRLRLHDRLLRPAQVGVSSTRAS